MSASNKKKLRREQVAAAEAKKQQAEKKEKAKLKLYTTLFVVVIVAMVAVFIVSAVLNSGVIERNTTALKVGDTSVSAVELNIYYLEAINNFYNENSSYLSMLGLTAGVPLNEQECELIEEGTWADYFLEQAKTDIRNTYAVYNAAQAEGYKPNEEDQAAIDESIEQTMSSMKLAATNASFSNVNDYLTALYGKGANTKAFRHVYEVMMVATAYQIHHQNTIEYTDAQIEAKDAEDPAAYSSYDFNTYLIYTSNYLEGGTKDEEGNTTYSDAEKEASIVSAKADADALAAGTYATAEEFDAAILALKINEGKTAASTVSDGVRGNSISETTREWITDPSRQSGDVIAIPRTSTDSEGVETVTGYSVVYYRGVNDNNFALANVRHILIPFEGGSTDPNTGATTYSDAEKAAAKDKAQALLDEWKAGDANEDSFAALANEHSTDEGSNTNGGLYENVYVGQMVTNFNDWCFEEGRKAGDTGLVESSYGYHIMFYSSDAEQTNREYFVESALLTADMDAWYQEVVDANEIVDVNLSKLSMDLVLNAS